MGFLAEFLSTPFKHIPFMSPSLTTLALQSSVEILLIKSHIHKGTNFKVKTKRTIETTLVIRSQLHAKTSIHNSYSFKEGPPRWQPKPVSRVVLLDPPVNGFTPAARAVIMVVFFNAVNVRFSQTKEATELPPFRSQ